MMVAMNSHLIWLTLSAVCPQMKSWIIEIENDNLLDIRVNETLPEALNLSNLNLSAIDKNALANLSSLKTLDLANNKLKTLPVLTNLPNLESLNLANNYIQSGKFYVGLSSLKTLNISYNPLKSFEAGHFFGLTSSVNIYTQGLEIWTITTAMFENSVTATSHQFRAIENVINGINETFNTKLSSQENYNEIKVCMEYGLLTSAENLEIATRLPKGCNRTNLDSGTLNLGKMGIRTFENGWYRLQDQNVTSIVLSDNKIAQFSKELLNDLPAGILNVHMARNRIDKLEKGIIQNRNNIDVLDLSDNFISEIEDGALENLNITGWLLLDDNCLKDTKFLDSLPPYIRRVSADRNNIVEISDGIFTQFTSFKRLSLAGNNITEITAQKLRGFSTLRQLSLRKNRLQYIESGSFEHLTNLLSLDLTDNKISSFENGIFLGLENIRRISLESNEIEEALTTLLAVMPNSLRILSLGRNKIKLWKVGNVLFTRPFSLSWQRTITRNVPNLKVLDLHNNFITYVEGALFLGLENLVHLSLAANEITKIEKGFTKHLRNLQILDLSKNPIKKLENGALFDLPKDRNTIIHIDQIPLELIQGGLFNDE